MFPDLHLVVLPIVRTQVVARGNTETKKLF